jgi:hypothetical protein
VSPLVLVFGILFTPVALAAGSAVWAAASLLRDVWHCQRRSGDTGSRAGAGQPASLADEAQRWLQRH